MLKEFLRIKKFLGRNGSGNFGSLLHGSGIDLAENRQYSPGDEKRSINRKMSAKYDKLFVNLFHEEKALDVHLCCDVNYNRKGKNMKSFLRFFAGLTEYLSSEKAHITGRIGSEEFISLEKPPYQKQFLDALDVSTTTIFPVYQSTLGEMLKTQLALPKKKLIVIVSDFLTYSEEEKRLVDMLMQKHEVRLVTVMTEQSVVMNTHHIDLDVFGQ